MLGFRHDLFYTFNVSYFVEASIDGQPADDPETETAGIIFIVIYDHLALHLSLLCCTHTMAKQAHMLMISPVQGWERPPPPLTTALNQDYAARAAVLSAFRPLHPQLLHRGCAACPAPFARPVWYAFLSAKHWRGTDVSYAIKPERKPSTLLSKALVTDYSVAQSGRIRRSSPVDR